jgi:predicted alpha/beta hydrolase family esterase
MKIKIAGRFFMFSMAMAGLLQAFGCQPKLPYTEMEIESFRYKNSGVELFFKTRSGQQSAFYIFPESNLRNFPQFLVIAYPGIGSRALDWQNIINHDRNPETGFLLIDYPGRGNCEGLMRPKFLPDSTLGALTALKDYLNIEQDHHFNSHLILLGHSFGCAAALQIAPRLNPDRIVLIAPFTTLRKALFKKVGPLAWLNPDQMDNRQQLKELCAQPNPPLITIIHGNGDQSVPVEMGRELATQTEGCVVFHEIKGAGHVDILKLSEDMIIKAILGESPEKA